MLYYIRVANHTHLCDADFRGHVQTTRVGALFDERPIEEVPVVGHEDLGPHFLHMCKESPQERLLVDLVEHLGFIRGLHTARKV